MPAQNPHSEGQPAAPDESQRAPFWVRIAAWTFILLLIYLQRQADTDLWGHIAYGRDHLESGVALTDPYAYTNPGYRWIGHEAGSEIVFYLVWEYAGVTGLLLLRMLMPLAAVLLIRNAMRQVMRNEYIALTFLALMTAAMAPNLLVRPQLFTYLLLALLVNVIFRYRVTGRRYLLWAAPLIIWIWAGCHGGFVAGLGLWFAFCGLQTLHLARTAAGEQGEEPPALRRRVGVAVRGSWPLWLSAALSAGLTFLNPLAPRIWECIYVAMTNPMTPRRIVEWYRIFTSFPTFPDFIYIIFLLLLPFALAIGRPWRDTVGIGLAVLMMAVAASSYRHVVLMTMVLAPVLARWFSEALERPRLRVWVRNGLFGAAVLTVVVGTLLCWVFLRRSWKPEMTWKYPMPQSAVRFIERTDLRGNLYCEFAWGQYLIWHVSDRCRIGMDGRYDTCYPLDVIRKHFAFLYEADTAALDEPPADMVLVDGRLDAAPRGDRFRRPVVEVLREDPEWTLVYRDQLAWLFLRTDLLPSFRMRNPELGELPVEGRNPEPGLFP